MSFTAKVQVTGVREYGEGDGRSVALSFSPDYRDGRNADWAHNTPGLSLSMTMRGDVADRLALREGQAYTLTFERDGEEQGIVAPAESTEGDEPEDVEVYDHATGDTKLVTATEAARLGYDMAGGAPQGVSGAGAQGSQQPTGEVRAEDGSTVDAAPAAVRGENEAIVDGYGETSTTNAYGANGELAPVPERGEDDASQVVVDEHTETHRAAE